MTSDEIISGVISNFSCIRDNDIESFIKEKAILFDNKGKSKTHLLLSEEALVNGRIEIAAYFSLAIQMLRIPEGTSVTQIRRLDGFYSRRGGEPITEIPSFLIGQLAKDDKFTSKISGALLLEYALSTISVATKMIGGRVVYIECRDILKLISFYENNGFKVLRQDPNDGLIQKPSSSTVSDLRYICGDVVDHSLGGLRYGRSQDTVRAKTHVTRLNADDEYFTGNGLPDIVGYDGER